MPPRLLLVEPNPGGHRFQAAANVARAAVGHWDVELVTSKGARSSEPFSVYLADLPLTVHEVFDGPEPDAWAVARGVHAASPARGRDRVILMEADLLLAAWPQASIRTFGWRGRPNTSMFLTRYPARLEWADPQGWKLRLAKALLALICRLTGTADDFSGFAGRDDLRGGRLVRLVRDPEVCTAHSRDRAAIRAELGLDQDDVIYGLVGSISRGKGVDTLCEVLVEHQLPGKVLVAGNPTPEVAETMQQLPAEQRERLILRLGFLSNDELDKCVAASDLMPILMDLRGPSGIMGKALAAEVPMVVNAGSKVRRREIEAIGGGSFYEAGSAQLAAALRRELESPTPRNIAIPVATEAEFGAGVLGPHLTQQERTR